MHWCFFSPGFRSLQVLAGDSRESGGAEAQVAHLASMLAEAGHDVTMIYGCGDGAAPPTRVAGLRCLDAVPAWTRPGSLVGLWRTLRELSPDVLYARLPSDFLPLLGLYARLHPDTRFVYALAHDSHCRASSAWDHRRWFHAPLYALGLHSAHTIAVQHAGQMGPLRRELRQKAVLVPNMVWRRAETPRCFREADIDVVWIGKIRPEKRLDRLFDLAAARPDLRIAVVGGFDPTMDPADRAALERRGAALANVTTLGPLRAEEVQGVLTRSRVLVVTSDSEGFPNVMLEAWAAGVPVVSLVVDPGGVIVREGIGVVSGTAARFCEHVAALARDEGMNRRLGALGFAYVRRSHGADAVLRALIDGAAPPRRGEPAAVTPARESVPPHGRGPMPGGKPVPSAPPAIARKEAQSHARFWGLAPRPPIVPQGAAGRAMAGPPAGGQPMPVAVMIGQLGQGGSERQLYMFLARCDRTRWSPTLFVSGELGYWEAPIRALGIPVVLLKGHPLAKMGRFRAACRALKPACFFSWSSYTNVYALMLLGSITRRIGSFRNALFADLPRRMRGAWTWGCVAGISVAVCNSAETVEGLRARSARPLPVYVPNGVEIPEPDEVAASRMRWRTALGLAPDEVLVLGVGRLAPQKNFALFVDVIARVVLDAPVQAVIVGHDMGELSALRSRVHACGLGSAIRFLGRVPDAREVICAADILLLTSDHEGMPNVVLEAMAAGVACVSTRVNAVGDLVRCGETGFLAPLRDAPALVAHVTRLARDAPLRRRIGQAARAAVASKHDPDAVARQLWALCETGAAETCAEEWASETPIGAVRA